MRGLALLAVAAFLPLFGAMSVCAQAPQAPAAATAAFASGSTSAERTAVTVPKCPATLDDLVVLQPRLPALRATLDVGLVASGQPIKLKLAVPAGVTLAVLAPYFHVAGKVKQWAAPEAAFDLPVLSWTAATDGRSGDLVVGPMPSAPLNILAVPTLTMVVAVCGQDGLLQTSTILRAFVSVRVIAAVGALLLTVLLYVFGASAVSSVSGWQRLNPLLLSMDGSGRASLSYMQILYFSVIVLYMLTYILLRSGILSSLSEDVLLLLGIAGAGSVASRLATNNTRRLSFDNWAWAKNKGWTTNTGYHVNAPHWRDLISTDDIFDPYKFQMVSFSFVIGISLLTFGLNELAGFTIPQALLGVIGLSQVTYVGGKIVAPSTFGDLDEKLTTLRKAEEDFVKTTAAAWLPPTPRGMELATAVNSDPQGYIKFKTLVSPAWTMFEELFVARGPNPNLEPST